MLTGGPVVSRLSTGETPTAALSDLPSFSATPDATIASHNWDATIASRISGGLAAGVGVGSDPAATGTLSAGCSYYCWSLPDLLGNVAGFFAVCLRCFPAYIFDGTALKFIILLLGALGVVPAVFAWNLVVMSVAGGGSRCLRCAVACAVACA